MKQLAALLLLALPVLAQRINTGPSRLSGTSGPCVAPTMTSRWAGYNTSNVCNHSGGGSGTCTLGTDTAGSFIDLVTATNNNATATPSITFKPSAINGLPSFIFPGGQWLQLNTGLFPTLSGSFTLYAVVKPNTASGHASPIIGGDFSGHPPEWGITIPVSNQLQYFNSQGTVGIGTGTFVIPTASFTTMAMTYSFTTHVLNLYICSGGTCNSDGSFTNAGSFSSPGNTLIGSDGNNGQTFTGEFAELGFLNSINISGIAAWSQCKYGI